MEEMFDETQEIAKIPVTYIEVDGVRAECGGFTAQRDGDKYMFDVTLVDNGPMVKSIAGAYLNEDAIDFVITEDTNTITVKGAEIIAMYGFKSFSLVTTNKPVVS